MGYGRVGWLILASSITVSSILGRLVGHGRDQGMHGNTQQIQRQNNIQQHPWRQTLDRQSISGSSGGFSGGGGSSSGSGDTGGSVGSEGGFSGDGGSSSSASNSAIGASDGALAGLGFGLGLVGATIGGDIGSASGGSSGGSSGSSSSSTSFTSSNDGGDSNSDPLRFNFDQISTPEVPAQGVIAAGLTVFIIYLLKFWGISVLEDFSKPVLTDFPDCGRRNTTAGGTLDECLWGCKWRSNPLYRKIEERSFTSVVGTRKIEIYWNLLKIPEDLNCFLPCAEEFLKDVFISDLQEIPGKDACTERNYLTYIDCYIDFRRELFDNNSLIWTFRNFRDIVIGTCLLASEKPALFEGANCENILPKVKRRKRKKGVYVDSDRIFGASSEPILNYDTIPRLNIQKYPWLCSLRTRGFRGRHRCGVTLLYGPTADPVEDCNAAPTILVSAAHCNFVCKNDLGNTLEFCCCRDPEDQGSCRNKSSYCRGNPTLQEAIPRDLQIVCGEWSIEEVPEEFSFENELVLDVLKFTNHPAYDAKLGPIGGHDISVYHVNTQPLCERNGVKQGDIYPACLPRSSYKENEAVLAAWIDPEPSWTFKNNRPYFQYRVNNLWPRQARITQTECKDPAWMKGSNTFYPAATQCYTDPSGMSCHSFGTSGSPAMRKLQDGGIERYSWIGPLSFYSGCDRAWIFYRPSTGINSVLEAGENPGVFTDGGCYLDWIADQYEMRMPKDYVKDASCLTSSGDRTNADQSVCLTSTGTYCDFTAVNPGTNKTVNQCQTYSIEGYAKSINTCIDRTSPSQTAICSNNCRGVDPKTIIVGGLPFLAAATGGLGISQAFIGWGALTALTLGGASTAAVGGYYACAGPLYCQVGQQCCLLVMEQNRGLRCPTTC